MRTYSVRFLGSLILALLAGCDTGPTGPNKASQLYLSGRIVSTAGAALNGASLVVDAEAASVRKVLVYREFGVADVVSLDAQGRFQVPVDRAACGLVFLDAADDVVGYLTLPSGLGVLPLMVVDSATTLVDLSTITISDSVATPTRDPVAPGGAAEMTPEEIAAFRLQSALFASIVRNLDMDHDGVIDVLTDRSYSVVMGADFRGGVAPASDPGPTASLPELNVFHFYFTDFTRSADVPAASLRAPGGQSFLVHNVDSFSVSRPRGTPWTATGYHWVLQNTSWLAFQPGSYSVTYAGRPPVTFMVTDPLNGSNYIVAARLWYEANAGRITRVHWRWRMLDGRPIDASRLMQRQVQLQFGYGFTRQVTHHVSPRDTTWAVDIDTNGLTQIILLGKDLFGNGLATFYAFE